MVQEDQEGPCHPHYQVCLDLQQCPTTFARQSKSTKYMTIQFHYQHFIVQNLATHRPHFMRHNNLVHVYNTKILIDKSICTIEVLTLLHNVATLIESWPHHYVRTYVPIYLSINFTLCTFNMHIMYIMYMYMQCGFTFSPGGPGSPILPAVPLRPDLPGMP